MNTTIPTPLADEIRAHAHFPNDEKDAAALNDVANDVALLESDAAVMAKQLQAVHRDGCRTPCGFVVLAAIARRAKR